MKQYIKNFTIVTGYNPKTLTAVARALKRKGLLNVTNKGHNASHLNEVSVAAFVMALGIEGSPASIAFETKKRFALTRNLPSDSEEYPQGIDREFLRSRLWNALIGLLAHSTGPLDIEMIVEQHALSVVLNISWKERGHLQTSTFRYGSSTMLTSRGRSVWVSVGPHVFHVAQELLSIATIRKSRAKETKPRKLRAKEAKPRKQKLVEWKSKSRANPFAGRFKNRRLQHTYETYRQMNLDGAFVGKHFTPGHDAYWKGRIGLKCPFREDTPAFAAWTAGRDDLASGNLKD